MSQSGSSLRFVDEHAQYELPRHTINKIYQPDQHYAVSSYARHIAMKGGDELHGATGRGEGVKVAVLDTGCDKAHRERGLLQNVTDAVDFTNSRFGWEDRHGHGTHVLSLVGGNGANYVSTAPGCEMFSVKVLGDDGRGDNRWIINGIIWAVEKGAHVINMSLGSPSYSRELDQACRWAAEQGVCLVAAAGNSGQSRSERGGFPARLASVMSVTNIDYSNRINRSSSSTSSAQFCDYGTGVLGAWPGLRMASLTGTSMASPVCAGTIALLYGMQLAHSGKIQLFHQGELVQVMIESAVDLGAAGRDRSYGNGLVDMIKAAGLVAEVLQGVEPKPDPDPDPDKPGCENPFDPEKHVAKADIEPFLVLRNKNTGEIFMDATPKGTSIAEAFRQSRKVRASSIEAFDQAHRESSTGCPDNCDARAENCPARSCLKDPVKNSSC